RRGIRRDRPGERRAGRRLRRPDGADPRGAARRRVRGGQLRRGVRDHAHRPDHRRYRPDGRCPGEVPGARQVSRRPRLVVVVVTAALAACGGDDASTTTTRPAPAAQVTTDVTSTANTSTTVPADFV